MDGNIVSYCANKSRDLRNQGNGSHLKVNQFVSNLLYKNSTAYKFIENKQSNLIKCLWITCYIIWPKNLFWDLSTSQTPSKSSNSACSRMKFDSNVAITITCATWVLMTELPCLWFNLSCKKKGTGREMPNWRVQFFWKAASNQQRFRDVRYSEYWQSGCVRVRM